MKSDTVIRLLMLVIGALMIMSFLLWIKTCEKPPPKTIVKTKTIIDTVVVSSVKTKLVYRDRIVARIDSVKTGIGEQYTASMDTLVIMDNAQIHTAIEYKHPERLFTFKQDIAVKIDTIYINKTQIIETTKVKVKTNWTNTAIGTAIGFCLGIGTSIYLAQ